MNLFLLPVSILRNLFRIQIIFFFFWLVGLSPGLNVLVYMFYNYYLYCIIHYIEYSTLFIFTFNFTACLHMQSSLWVLRDLYMYIASSYFINYYHELMHPFMKVNLPSFLIISLHIN
jgi:hypothetical protein